MARSKSTAVLTSPPDWQAESDMRTLIEAESIKADKKRFNAAARMAKKKAEEMESAFNLEPGEKT